MKCSHGDIWEFYNRGFYAVIPVNIGWKQSTMTSRYLNVMGRGLALQAKGRFPACQEWLGNEYFKTFALKKEMGDLAWLRVFPGGRLIFFPTKPLDKAAPWRSWRTKADAAMIGKHLDQLPALITREKIDRVAIPMVGAGLGMLEPKMIKDLIFEKLGRDHRFTLVIPHVSRQEEEFYANFRQSEEDGEA
jgi:hypothetical protein